MTLRAVTPAMGHAASLAATHNAFAYSPQLACGRDSQDELDDEEDDDEGYDRADEFVEMDVEDDGFRWLDVGVLLQAMRKCNQAYHENDRMEFYNMVAEEYALMVPGSQVSIEDVERNEIALRRLALAILNGSPASGDLFIPHNVEEHEQELINFYRIMAEVGQCEPIAWLHRGLARTHTPSPPNHPASPYGSVVSTAEQTDGSASNPATPVVDEGSDGAQQSANGAVHSSTTEKAAEQATEADSTVAVRSSTAAVGNSLSLLKPGAERIAYRHAWEVLAEKTRARDESSARLRQAEERIQAERILVEQRKEEYKQLKQLVKSYRVREKMKKRLAAAMDKNGDFQDDAGGGRSLKKDRKALRKETKRLKELQETLTREFKLLKSKVKCRELKMDQELAELKRVYVDSCLFTEVELA